MLFKIGDPIKRFFHGLLPARLLVRKDHNSSISRSVSSESANRSRAPLAIQHSELERIFSFKPPFEIPETKGKEWDTICNKILDSKKVIIFGPLNDHDSFASWLLQIVTVMCSGAEKIAIPIPDRTEIPSSIMPLVEETIKHIKATNKQNVADLFSSLKTKTELSEGETFESHCPNEVNKIESARFLFITSELRTDGLLKKFFSSSAQPNESHKVLAMFSDCPQQVPIFNGMLKGMESYLGEIVDIDHHQNSSAGARLEADESRDIESIVSNDTESPACILHSLNIFSRILKLGNIENFEKELAQLMKNSSGLVDLLNASIKEATLTDIYYGSQTQLKEVQSLESLFSRAQLLMNRINGITYESSFLEKPTLQKVIAGGQRSIGRIISLTQSKILRNQVSQLEKNIREINRFILELEKAKHYLGDSIGGVSVESTELLSLLRERLISYEYLMSSLYKNPMLQEILGIKEAFQQSRNYKQDEAILHKLKAAAKKVGDRNDGMAEELLNQIVTQASYDFQSFEELAIDSIKNAIASESQTRSNNEVQQTNKLIACIDKESQFSKVIQRAFRETNIANVELQRLINKYLNQLKHNEPNFFENIREVTIVFYVDNGFALIAHRTFDGNKTDFLTRLKEQLGASSGDNARAFTATIERNDGNIRTALEPLLSAS